MLAKSWEQRKLAQGSGKRQTRAVDAGLPSSAQMSLHPLVDDQHVTKGRGLVALTVNEGGGDGRRRHGSFWGLLLLQLGVSRHEWGASDDIAASAAAAAAIFALSRRGNAAGYCRRAGSQHCSDALPQAGDRLKLGRGRRARAPS